MAEEIVGGKGRSHVGCGNSCDTRPSHTISPSGLVWLVAYSS